VRVRNHLEYVLLVRKLEFDWKSLLFELSEPLRAEVALQRCKSFFLNPKFMDVLGGGGVPKPQFLKNLVSRMEHVVFSPGDFCIEQGEVGHEVFFLSLGRVVVVANQVQVATRTSGDCVGEIALLLPDVVRTASIVAEAFCEAHKLTRGDFRACLRDFPDMEERVRRIAAERLGELRKSSTAPPTPRQTSTTSIAAPAEENERPSRNSSAKQDRNSSASRDSNGSSLNRTTSVDKDSARSSATSKRASSFYHTRVRNTSFYGASSRGVSGFMKSERQTDRDSAGSPCIPIKSAFAAVAMEAMRVTKDTNPSEGGSPSLKSQASSPSLIQHVKNPRHKLQLACHRALTLSRAGTLAPATAAKVAPAEPSRTRTNAPEPPPAADGGAGTVDQGDGGDSNSETSFSSALKKKFKESQSTVTNAAMGAEPSSSTECTPASAGETIPTPIGTPRAAQQSDEDAEQQPNQSIGVGGYGKRSRGGRRSVEICDHNFNDAPPADVPGVPTWTPADSSETEELPQEMEPPLSSAAAPIVVPDSDLAALRALLYTMKQSVVDVADMKDAEAAPNWMPIIFLASVPLCQSEFELIFMISELARRALPDAARTASPLQLVLDSMDPEHEMNFDDKRAAQLRDILLARGRAMIKALEAVAGDGSGCTMRDHAASIRERVYTFISNEA